MRTILILNPKGGCGKSTLATNIASYFSCQGQVVTLADCDPQSSSKDWLMARPPALATIHSAVLVKDNLRVSKDTEILIMDTPAAISEQRLHRFISQAETMVIPINASPIDIRAAERFIKQLFSFNQIINKKIKIATVANRIREDTLIAAKLDYYLSGLTLPNNKRISFITMLRNSQNYIHAAERGMSIFELPPSKTYYDREQWAPLLRWLSSSKSIAGK